MNIFFEEHEEILQLLNKHQVEYLLIGGYAVHYYGYHRMTGDMDLWIGSDKDNIRRLQDAFREGGFEEEDLAYLDTVDFTQPVVFWVGTEPQRIDFITRVNLVEFEEAYARKEVCKLENGLILNIVQYRDLVLMKMNTGRTKDKADIEELQKVNRKKRE